MLFGNNREALRRQFLDAWQKVREGRPVTPLEDLIAGVIAEHPEYHAILEEGEAALERDWTPEQGETNPFLHMGMHIAVREQLSIDRPPGVRAAFEALRQARGDAHAAEHEMVECLAETLWEAQRYGRTPDETAYLQRVRNKARR
ncbi:MAG TPA: DUF1841 family protein [Gammaproteobacteria bacterium]|nr:DUF1841 family protein [Gammaproteobacteria bacterium]